MRCGADGPGAGALYLSIHYLRALAATGVFLSHLHPTLLGFSAGVDVFFVISGFVMGSSGPRQSPGAFFRKRLIRVVPLYWMVTFAACGMAAAGLIGTVVDPEKIAKSLLFFPYADPQGKIWPIVVPGWTLNLEMLFYAIFALALFSRWPVLVCSGCLLVLAGVGLVVPVYAVPVILWTSPLLVEFVFGLALSQMRWTIGRRAGLAAVCLGLVALVMFSASGVSAGGVIRVLTWGVPAALIVSGAVQIETQSVRFPSVPALTVLGDASYSFYLLHYWVLVAGHRLIGATTVADVVFLAAGWGVAILSYQWIERPILQWCSGRISTTTGARARP